MPKIFEHLGIIIFFHSNEHKPVHVHGKYGECESKAELYIEDGQITEIKIKIVKGKRPLTGVKLNDFEDFIEVYAYQVIQKWIDYFVYHKDTSFEQINTKIR